MELDAMILVFCPACSPMQNMVDTSEAWATLLYWFLSIFFSISPCSASRFMAASSNQGRWEQVRAGFYCVLHFHPNLMAPNLEFSSMAQRKFVESILDIEDHEYCYLLAFYLCQD